MKNGSIWQDTEGRDIQAHGGCILPHNGRYYWYGENKDADTTRRSVPFLGFCCYSSEDLLHWHNEGVALCDPRLPQQGVGERPCVLYSEATGQFVMWFHWDNREYSLAQVGVAVSDTPAGPFRVLDTFRPCGYESRDMTAFTAKDGRAYLFCSSDHNTTMRIFELDKTCTALTGNHAEAYREQEREAPAVFDWGEGYGMLTSGCSGWAPNTMLFAKADAPMGSWRLLGDPCEGPGARQTFGAQSAHVFQAQGRLYALLDHWQPDDLRHSGYTALPIQEGGQFLTLPWQENWEGLL